jgi:hypothetical protein
MVRSSQAVRRLNLYRDATRIGSSSGRGNLFTTMRVQVSSSKLTLYDIRERAYFDISALVECAGVDVSIINRMLNRQPVQRYQAELVLTALTDELGEDYTLDTVDIVLFPEGDKEGP